VTIRNIRTHSSRKTIYRKSMAASLLMAVLPMGLLSSAAMAANLTWDSGGAHPTTPADGSGNWDTQTAFWSNGTTDVVWDNVSTAVFGSNNGAAGTVTIDDASGSVTAAGLTFKAASSGNYTVAASGADTLTFSGTSPLISVASGVSATISAPITGAFGSYAVGATITGLVINGTGNLTLSGVNSYTGSTIIENNGVAGTGTSAVLSGSLGSAAANVYVGLNPTAAMTDASALTLNGGTLTASTLFVDYNFSEGAISTTAGDTVNVQGASTINANTLSIDAGRASGSTKGGDGSLILASGATLTLHDAGNDGGAVTLLDIANYSYETGGSTGTGITGTVDFSAGAVNGNITTINIGTGKAGNDGTVGDTGPATGLLAFANGTLNAATINIARFGSENSVGTLTLAAGGTGTLTAGSITFGATGQGTLDTQNSKSIGVITISGGTLALTGSIVANPNGIAESLSATINLNGGTLNLEGNSIGPAGNIITLVASAGTLENVASINPSGTAAQSGLTTSGTITQILTLTGTNSYTGTTTIGGDTVIANGAAAMGTGGALAVNSGALDLHGFSQSVSSLSGTGAGAIITNNGTASPVTLTVTAGSGTYAGVIQNGTSSVGLNVSGALALTSTTAQTYSGATVVNSGASLTIASINSSTAVSVDGTMVAAGTVGTLLLDQGGTLTPGALVSSGTTGILNANSLVIGSGGATMNFLATSATAFDQLMLGVSGAATFNGVLTLNATIGNSLPAGNYTLVSAPGGGINISDINAGTITVGGGGTTRIAASFHETSTLIQLIVAGGAANLSWTDGSTSTNWENTQTDANWHRTDAGTAGLATQFYNGDNVTFDSTSNLDAKPNYSVNISAPVQPGSVLFTNGSSTNYTLSSNNGNGIGGTGGLTVDSNDGTGIVTLNTANTYSGSTTVTAGTLIIGGSGSVAGSTFVVASGAIATVNSGGALTTPTLNVSGAFNVGGTVGGTTLTLGSPAVATVISGGKLATTNVNVTGGSLTIQSGGSLNSANLTVASGASFTAASGAALAATLNLTDNGTASISDPTINTLNGTNGAATLTLNANNLTVNASGSFAGQILDNGSGGSFTVNGGTQILTGANNYSGTTTINSGATLQLDAGSNTGSLSAVTAISDSGTFIYDRSDSPSFSNPLSGGGAFQQNGGGTLTLAVDNSAFSGALQVFNGTVVQGSATPFTLGSGSGGLVLGTPGNNITTTPTGTLRLNSSVSATSVGSLSATNSSLVVNATPDVIAIPAGVTLTDNGTFSVGTNYSLGQTNNTYTALQATGGGSLVLPGTVTVGQGFSFATVDLSGLNSVAISGAVNIGNGAALAGALTLANTTVNGVAPVNSITTTTLNIATSATADTPGGVSYLNLGSGTNTLLANAFNLGTGRGSGVIQFAAGAPSTASVTIADTSGGSSDPIILANASTNGTFIGTGSFLNFAGFTANVQASSLIVSENTANLAAGAIAGVTFDTGTFTVNGPVTIAADTGGSSTTGPTGTITIGGGTPNNTATGVFTINGSVTLGNFTNANAFSAASAVATATLTINGGVANINGAITNNSTQGTTISTLNLNGGTLNMNGNAIGGSGAVNSGSGPITVNLANAGISATLQNLGGGGINGAGITMNGLGTLILAGSNTYSGNTNVTAGELDIGSGGSITSTNVGVGAGATFAVLAGGSIPASTTITPIGGSGGTVTIDAPLTIASAMTATLNLNATLQIQGTSKANILNIQGAASAWTAGLDLTTSKFILETTPTTKATAIAALHDQVHFGKTSTEGIFTSSTLPVNYAIAVVDNGALSTPFSTFGGVSVDPNSILVGAELLGDTNLDGQVDITDLNAVLHNLGTTTKAWSSGNFDGAATIDLTDLNDVLNNLGQTNPNASSVIGSGNAGTAAPEPASLAMLGLGAVALSSRRRKVGASKERA
jgi:fibronectin-binding autotransporter adhesin